MNRSRVVHHLLCFVLLFGVLGSMVGNQVVLAAQESSNGSLLLPPNQEQSTEDKVEFICKYPVLRGESGISFEFDVDMNYQGSEARRFDLTTTVPSGWQASILAGRDDKEINVISVAARQTYPELLTIRFSPSLGKLPEPGEYIVTLETSSGDIKDTIELKAVVTARYEMRLATDTGRLNTEVTAGMDNHLSISLINLSTIAIENVSFSSSKPEGWNITFNPDKVESLESGFIQEIDVVINPPEKTIAGDYSVILYADSTHLFKSLELRVTVLTPTVWGWVAILIVVAVIAGLGVVFWRLGRR